MIKVILFCHLVIFMLATINYIVILCVMITSKLLDKVSYLFCAINIEVFFVDEKLHRFVRLYNTHRVHLFSDYREKSNTWRQPVIK